MEEKLKKYNLPLITASVYVLSPDRYELRKGTEPDAPPCPYGHRFKWIGYDRQENKYLRVTKSVFKRLIALKDQSEIAQHDKYFEENY